MSKKSHSLRKSQGNMYEFVSHVWSPILGCSHQCTYCYVRKNHQLPTVPILNENDFPDLGTSRTIFVGHLCDMFSSATNPEYIRRVIEHCRKFNGNKYVFQTKNLAGLKPFMSELPSCTTIGTTIETNREELLREISQAPAPNERVLLFKELPSPKFVTIEPILDFDHDVFLDMILLCRPDYVNIGADSKGHGLREPPKGKLGRFIADLIKAKVEIRKKINLERILGENFRQELEEASQKPGRVG